MLERRKKRKLETMSIKKKPQLFGNLGLNVLINICGYRPFFNAFPARFLIETKRNIVTLCGLGE